MMLLTGQSPKLERPINIILIPSSLPSRHVFFLRAYIYASCNVCTCLAIEVVLTLTLEYEGTSDKQCSNMNMTKLLSAFS